MLDNQPYTFDRVFRIFVGILAVYGIYWLLAYLSDVLVPFAVAFLLAYLLNPIVLRVQRRVTNRAAAVAITLIGVLLSFALILVLLIPMITREMRNMAEVVKKVSADAQMSEKIEKAFEFGLKLSGEQTTDQNADAPTSNTDLITPPTDDTEAGTGTDQTKASGRDPHDMLAERIQQTLNDYFKSGGLLKLLEDADLTGIAQMVIQKLLPGAKGLFRGALSLLAALAGALVVTLYLIFMLLDYQGVKDEWKDLIPQNLMSPILEFIQEFDKAMNRHFRAQALVAGIVGILFAIGFTIIGLPMGILLGLFVGLLNMVPYLQTVGIIPAALLGLMNAVESNSSIWWQLGLVLLVFGVVQLIQDAILTPKIMGDVTGMSPAMILLSISVWGKLLGFLGLIIALPMSCLVLAYYRRVISMLLSGLSSRSEDSGETPAVEE